MKHIVIPIAVVVVLVVSLIPWRDWIMALRIRSAKKSLADGKEVLSTIETLIAEIKGKLTTKPETTEQLTPLLLTLEAQQRHLTTAVGRFTERIQYVEALRAVVNHKGYTPEEANAAILKLTDPKLDEFLAQLNGDDKIE
jgi:hypothetical protein